VFATLSGLLRKPLHFVHAELTALQSQTPKGFLRNRRIRWFEAQVCIFIFYTHQDIKIRRYAWSLSISPVGYFLIYSLQKK
jgi:hypothetical protein